MNNKYLWIILLVIVLIAGFWWFSSNQAAAPVMTDDMTATSTNSADLESTNGNASSTIDISTTGDKGPKTATVINMDSGAYYFRPSIIKARLGQKITINITSKGRHNFALDEFKVDVDTPGGETTKVEFTASKKGTFEFYCNIPGHRQNGQVGTLIVE